MQDLDCFISQRVESLKRREHDWVVTFGPEVSLTIACLWRLLEDQRIRFTSADDGQQFGLPAPVDAVAELNRRIGGTDVVSVELRDGTLDLTLRFSTGHTLEVIPDSSGYESWEANISGTSFIAAGGGELATLRSG